VKRVIGLVFMCGAASCMSVASAAGTQVAAAAPSHAQRTAAQQTAAQRAAAQAAARAAALLLLAPADEYFGPLKQSVVGMRNSIRELGWNYDVNHDIWHQTFVSALLTERAVRDWVKKYPHDGQIPRTIFLLQRLYTKVLSQESRDHAHAIAQWLLVSYAKSPQARQLRKTLAVEQLAPLPSPTPSLSPESSLAPGSSAWAGRNANAVSRASVAGSAAVRYTGTAVTGSVRVTRA